MGRFGWLVRVAVTLAASIGNPGAVHAAIAVAPDSFGIAIENGAPALGAGFDSAAGAPRGEPGACVEDLGTERSEEPAASFSLVTLTRAGGRLVVGVHVAAVTAVETLASPRMTDASRRLGGTDAAAFRELCGDGYVAQVQLGGHWLGEIEVDPGDAARAGAALTTGTWSDPEPFRAALEALVKYRVTARELPDGKRAATVDLSPSAFVERAVAFPERVTSDNEKAFLAVFAGYVRESLSGVVLPGASEVDGREVAERIFRAGQGTAGSTRASRAAEMRRAQVQRYVPDPAELAAEQGAAPIEINNESLARLDAAPPAAAAPNSSPLRARPAAASSAPAQVRKQAAFVFEERGAPVVYATTVAPGGVHAERQRQRFYWVPGAAIATPAIEQAIAAAMEGAPVRGVTVAIVEVGANVVVMTDAPPLAGVHSIQAGERRAWIAGVTQPDAAQQAALAEAIRAERAAE